MKLVVVDYGLCNLLSVYNGLKHLGVKALVSEDPGELQDADACILPGVGAFESGMQGLRRKGFIGPIKDFAQSGRPFLGICLGMQMLMSRSFEFGEHDGLDLIEGEVVSFLNHKIEVGYDFKVPHIGWNGLYRRNQSWDGSILAQLDNGDEMYFVHSFYAVPRFEDNVLAETEYAGRRFCSVVFKKNVYGCQFHPEKSCEQGLMILKNFVELKK